MAVNEEVISGKGSVLSLVEKHRNTILEMNDDQISALKFYLPGVTKATPSQPDADGFTISSLKKGKNLDELDREGLQIECWNKFKANPQLNTSVRGRVGRLIGFGFETTSEIWRIQQVIDEIVDDPRNDIEINIEKYMVRSEVEGELFISLTCHTDGFIEVDFIDPSCIPDDGIVYHPTKNWFPILFNVDLEDNESVQIPSINVARYPYLMSVLDNGDIDHGRLKYAKSEHINYAGIGGFRKFIIYWGKGYFTDRSVGHIRTTIEWINHYERLKQYEIAHKEAVGAYLWVISIEDVTAFKRFLTLTDEERSTLGIMQEKLPGGQIIMPPGMTIRCESPNLPKLSGDDSDVLDMVSSGMNEAQDVMTGRSSGTFASVKASRGPMSDRTSDDVAYFDRFWRNRFWNSIFFLKSKISDFPEYFALKEAIEWGENKAPIFKTVWKKPHKLIEITYPISETTDLEGLARAFLGTKHGPMPESVGIPNKLIARRMGFGAYGRNRLRKASEDANYPPLIYSVDSERLQEVVEGEQPKEESSGGGINEEQNY